MRHALRLAGLYVCLCTTCTTSRPHGRPCGFPLSNFTHGKPHGISQKIIPCKNPHGKPYRFIYRLLISISESLTKNNPASAKFWSWQGSKPRPRAHRENTLPLDHRQRLIWILPSERVIYNNERTFTYSAKGVFPKSASGRF